MSVPPSTFPNITFFSEIQKLEGLMCKSKAKENTQSSAQCPDECVKKKCD